MVLYLPYNTALHRLHPSTKIVALILLLILTVTFTEIWQQLIILAGVLAIATLGRAFKNVGRILPLMVAITLFSCVTWSLFKRDGIPFWTFGPLSLSSESIQYGIAMALRLNAMLLAGSVFISSTRVEEFSYGLRALGLPFPVSFALSLSFRLVPLFFTRIGIVIQAQQSRGLDLGKGNLLQRARNYVPLLVPIFVYAIRDTDLLAMALESKGFGVGIRRTEYLTFAFGTVDVMILATLVSLNVVFWLV